MEQKNEVELRRARWAGRKGPWIATRSGERWYFVDCVPEDVVVADVAYSLAHQNRFNGHAPINVAVHSMRVADIVIALGHPEHELSALTHDGHEGYFGDVVSPIKRLIPEIGKLEDANARVVRTAFGVPVELPDVVVSADALALEEESRAYFSNHAEWGLPPAGHVLPEELGAPAHLRGNDLVDFVLRERPEAQARVVRTRERAIALYWHQRFYQAVKRAGVSLRARDLLIHGAW